MKNEISPIFYEYYHSGNLDFSNGNICDKKLIKIINALCCAENMKLAIQSLNFSNNQITGEGVCLIADNLVGFKKLERLNFSNNFLGKKGISQLMNFLVGDSHHNEKRSKSKSIRTKNHVLRELDVSGNQLGDSGAKVIAKILLFSETLITINIANNQITHIGAEALAAAIRTNRMLQHLNMENNSIGEKGLKLISEALVFNTSIKDLLIGNSADNDASNHMIKLILNMNNNQINFVKDQPHQEEVQIDFENVNPAVIDTIEYRKLEGHNQRSVVNPRRRCFDYTELGLGIAMVTIVPMIGLGAYYALSEVSEECNEEYQWTDILKIIGIFSLTILLVPMLFYGFYRSLKKMGIVEEKGVSTSAYRKLLSKRQTNSLMIEDLSIVKKINESQLLNDRSVELARFV